MSRLITRTIGASIGLVAVLAGSSPSLAQEEDESSTAGNTPTVEETATPSAAPTGAVARPPKKEDLHPHAHAGASLMLTGIVTLGLSYGPAVYVGNESTLASDRKLQTPFAGPWMDLVSRPGCMSAAYCGNEPAYQALLMFDGFFQALSGIELLAGLIEMGQDDPPSGKAPAPKAEAAVHVSPSALGAAGYGVTAFGNF
jgi:hypothetical protein